MRGSILALLALVGMAGCGGSTEVVSRSQETVLLRWDERTTSPAKVFSRAIDLCSGYGFNARRAFVMADDVAGGVHTTQYACRPAR
jgi:hypothetical protein